MWHDVISWTELSELVQYEFTLTDEAIEGFLVVSNNQPTAYLNQCPHQQLNLNWSPHQFFDHEQRYLLCNTHGALFEPDNGQCVSGPCVGEFLEALQVRVHQGRVQIQILPVRV